MIDESHLKLFETDRGEAEKYRHVEVETEILLPLTRQGFEALLERVTAVYDLPCDDAARMILIGWVHHISREKNWTTILEIARALHKQIANGLTTLLFEEIDQKRRAEKASQTPKLVPDSLEVTASNETSA